MSRPDLSRCLHLEEGLYWRLERSNEPSPDHAWQGRAAPAASFGLRPFGCRLHRGQIDAIGGGQVIETLGDAPRIWPRSPRSLCLTQAAHDDVRVLLVQLECPLEVGNILL